ncbi:hypothetical protein [Chryseobacterium sp. SORGH_AS_1048]|uniref:HD domain-containing protein n=1 Tax=Chryseobacterium sp. SORGH_AS_1048 TaxID=3041783 RepID=UPI00277DE469|nr:hypothetical protein [Chryseobacterium sp. SORGH_AS_1048]MDQ1099260.1 putative metal-dependent HD superfamily phosphohydrolase [Chryseobacterium sp. SORGH_AS_1048]
MNIQERFVQCCLQSTEDRQLIGNLWTELEKKYTEKGRHYHTLDHLDSMFRELDAVKDSIRDFDLVSFSVFYHDAIYDASSKSNEKKSAALADKRLRQLPLSPSSVRRIAEQIIATQLHEFSDDTDTNYLLDADLSVLGSDPATYTEYTLNIRKEYSVYPDFSCTGRAGKKCSAISWTWIASLKRRNLP